MARRQHQGVTEQAKAAKHRREDAQVLLDAERWRGAMYMAGYAVECLLKTKLMRVFRKRTLDALERELRRRGALSRGASVFTHELEALLRLTRGWKRLQQDRPTRVSFSIVNQWVPAWRYSADLSAAREAQAFLEAVDDVLRWVEHNI